MIAFQPQIRVFLYRLPTDMRKSFNGLVALTESALNQDPLSGSLFVFVNRRRTQMKILYFDTGGYCIWAKRLERGRFQPVAHDGDRLQLDGTQLQCLISGLDWRKARQSKRFSPTQPTSMVKFAS